MQELKDYDNNTIFDLDRLTTLEKEISRLFIKYRKEEVGYCLMKYQIKMMDKPSESQEIMKMTKELKTVS